MKFFAALIAKLTGTAEAPKTLDQARATHGEAKAALDRIFALFTAASLDLDALLAAGDNALKDLVAKLNQRAVDAEARATKAESDLAAAVSAQTQNATELTSVREQLAAFAAAAGVKLPDVSALAPDAAAAAIQTAVKQRISAGVSQQQAELGVPAANLPRQESADAASDRAELDRQYDELVASGKHVEAGEFFVKNLSRLYPAGRN